MGEVTKNNYAEYLKLFGVKNSKALDSLIKGNDGSDFDHSYEARNAARVAAGHEDGMLIRDGDESWKKTVPVSDEIRSKIIDTVKRQFLTNGNGMSEARDGDEIGAIMKEYRKNIPPAERLAVTWTLGEIAHNEAVRLVNSVKANDPGWTFGKQFDKSIFDNYVSGGIDLKV